VAGIAIRVTSGFRFYAADFRYATLEREYWQRVADLYAAANRIAAADSGARSVVRRRARRNRPHF
jgi:hypothetical protein